MYKKNAYKPSTYIILHLNGCYFNFCNSEVMTSFPHNLVLNSPPPFEFTLSEFLDFYNFLINERIFMKLVAKCLAFLSLSYQVYIKVCNPIPLIKHVILKTEKCYKYFE